MTLWAMAKTIVGLVQAHRHLQQTDAQDEKAELEHELRWRYPYADLLIQATALLNAGEYARAFPLMKRAADAGSTTAMVSLGMLYQSGCLGFDGGAGDARFEQAAFWYGRALDADQHPNAAEQMLALGCDYDRGNGVARDEVKAHECYVRAAKAENLTAAFNVAHNAMHGCGTPKNWHSARVILTAVVERTQDDVLAHKARRHLEQLNQWEREQAPQRDTWGRSGTLSRAQALEILDLGNSATKAQMKAAWIRLMQQNHPDAGGSNFFAKQLNAVRAVLGF